MSKPATKLASEQFSKGKNFSNPVFAVRANATAPLFFISPDKDSSPQLSNQPNYIFSSYFKAKILMAIGTSLNQLFKSAGAKFIVTFL